MTINGECTGEAPECTLWIGFGDDSEYIMLKAQIYGAISYTNTMMTALSTSNDTAASGDVTDFFSGRLGDDDIITEAELRFGNEESSWKNMTFLGDGWPIKLTFRANNDTVKVLWDEVLLKTYTEFAMDSDLVLVLSHNLKNVETLDIYDIELDPDQQCGVTMSPTVSMGPTPQPAISLPTMQPTSTIEDDDGTVRITPLWNDNDIANVELDDETQVVYDDLIVNDILLTNETYWLMKLHEDIDKWYVYIRFFSSEGA